MRNFFSKRDQIHTFTEEILNGKLHFLCSETPLLFANLLEYLILVLDDNIDEEKE